MKWYLEALENEGYIAKSPHAMQKYFSEIHKSNERVLTLVRDLLSVSRIDQGQIKDSPKLIDFEKMITEVVEQMQILAHKKKISLSLRIQDRIPSINIDGFRLHEVVENLVTNAIEYTPKEGSVRVTLGKHKDTLLLTVKDTGIGISLKDQGKLFTKFFRSEKAIGYNSEGSGLGLYVVKSYVQDWGGKVSVESKEGKGSTFTIGLPIKETYTNKRG